MIMFGLEINEDEKVDCWFFVLKDVLIVKYLIEFELFEFKYIILYWLLLVFGWFVVCVDIFLWLNFIFFFFICKWCVELVLEYIFFWWNIINMFDIIMIIMKIFVSGIMYIYIG